MAVTKFLSRAVTLKYPKKGRKLLMFPDASNLYWRCLLAQVLPTDFPSGKAAKTMHHEPLEFLDGLFKRAQGRWPARDKEGYFIVRGFKRGQWVLYSRATISRDRHNVANTSFPDV